MKTHKDGCCDGQAQQSVIKPEPGPITFEPALRQLGTIECPVCGRETAVFLTRNKRPFLNCGFCSARIFYNGRESMRLLKNRMKPVAD